MQIFFRSIIYIYRQQWSRANECNSIWGAAPFAPLLHPPWCNTIPAVDSAVFEFIVLHQSVQIWLDQRILFSRVTSILFLSVPYIHTTIAHWIQNPLWRTSEHNHTYNYMNLSILTRKIYFLSKKYLTLIRNREIQVITCMVMLTRSSERILNPMCYTGYIYDFAQSIFGEDF